MSVERNITDLSALVYGPTFPTPLARPISHIYITSRCLSNLFSANLAHYFHLI